MPSSLPCFPAFCWSAIPTSLYIFNAFNLVYTTFLAAGGCLLHVIAKVQGYLCATHTGTNHFDWRISVLCTKIEHTLFECSCAAVYEVNQNNVSWVVIAVCVNTYALYCYLAYCVEVPSPQVVGWVVTTSSAGPLDFHGQGVVMLVLLVLLVRLLCGGSLPPGCRVGGNNKECWATGFPWPRGSWNMSSTF